MTVDHAALADAIDPRRDPQLCDDYPTTPRAHLIAAADFIRTHATAIEAARREAVEEAAKIASDQARAYAAHIGEDRVLHPIKRTERIARAGAANACHDLANAIRALTPSTGDGKERL